MGIISFIKDAGEKLFGRGDDKASEAPPAAATTTLSGAPSDTGSPNPAALQTQALQANEAAATAIRNYIAAQSLPVDGLRIEYDGSQAAVTVSGEAPDQATREKIVLCCGNVHGVAKVNDMMTVPQPADESRYYTVTKGDTLSAIAKKHYGNANDYPKIFEANRPMLSHPDKIYPGQVLRIPG